MYGDLRQRAACVRLSLLLVLLGLAARGNLCAKDSEFPTAFYIVSLVTSDASPFWYRYVLDVSADGGDSIVRYIRIAPMDSMCAEAITVKAVTARLSGVSRLADGSLLHIF